MGDFSLPSPMTDPEGYRLALVERFATLFRGRVDARGSINGGCIRGRVTLKDYERHLTGEESLGVYTPIMDEEQGYSYFGAFDVDTKRDVPDGAPDEERWALAYPVAIKIRQQLLKLGAKDGAIHLARSRSCGAHIFWFFDDLVPAMMLRRIMMHVVKTIGSGKTETFPKQDRIDPSANQVGNYINLDAFGGLVKTRTNRVFANWETGQPISLEAALLSVSEQAASTLPEMYHSLPAAAVKGVAYLNERALNVIGGKATPCFELMLNTPAREGERNNRLYVMACHFVRQGAIEVVALNTLKDWNAKNEPPIDERELEATVRSAYRNNRTSLGCENPVVEPFCQPQCPVYKRAREARGYEDELNEITEPIILPDNSRLDLRNLVQTGVEPYYYDLVINGFQLEGLKGEEVFHFPKFQETVFNRLMKVIELPKRKGMTPAEVWRAHLAPLADKHEKLPVPAITTASGSLRSLIWGYFLNAGNQTSNKDEVPYNKFYEARIKGRPGTYAVFRFPALVNWVETSIKGVPPDQQQIWSAIRKDGGFEHTIWCLNPQVGKKTAMRVAAYPMMSIHPIDGDEEPDDEDGEGAEDVLIESGLAAD